MPDSSLFKNSTSEEQLQGINKYNQSQLRAGISIVGKSARKALSIAQLANIIKIRGSPNRTFAADIDIHLWIGLSQHSIFQSN